MVPGVLPLFGLACCVTVQEEAEPLWPTQDWAVSTPVAEGIDGEVLGQIDAEIRGGALGHVDSMLVIRHGRIVFERTYEHDYAAAAAGRNPEPHQYDYFNTDWHPFYAGTDLHTLQSVTKSVTSIVVGIAIARGEIAGSDEPVLSFFPERVIQDPDGRKARIRLEDVLTMRAGFDWDEWSFGIEDPRNDCMQLEASEDWIAYVLSKPMATDPGTAFVYNSGATQLLSGVVLEATGETIEHFADKHLFGPIGIERHHWKKTPGGLPDTEGGLYLVPRDLAKLGLLYLRNGRWEGERIVPAAWVERSVEPWVVDIRPEDRRSDPGYGYKWWILDDGTGAAPKCYAAMGFGGQFLLVVPALDLIGVFTGWNIHGGRYPSPTEVFRRRIVPAVAG